MAQTLFNGTTAVRPADVPNITQAVPFFGVKDIEASLRFYIDGLGFTMTRHWAPEGRIRWCWLELDRVAVMLQEYWKDGRPGGSPAGVPGQGVCICLMCEDAIAVYHNANARGFPYVQTILRKCPWGVPPAYSLVCAFVFFYLPVPFSVIGTADDLPPPQPSVQLHLCAHHRLNRDGWGR